MITRNQIKYIRSLRLKKNRDMHNCFVVEGEKIVAELLKSDFNVKAIFATKNWEQSAENTIQVNIVSEKDLKRISALKSPNKVVVITEIPQKYFDVFSIKKGLTLALEDINNPGNLGTIIRACDWFGIKNIICSNSSVDIYNPKVIQATMGSFLRVNVYYDNIKEIIKKFPNNFSIYGAFIDGKNISTLDLNPNALLVLGNESFGISNKLSKLITEKITIKSKKAGVESLNVAIATSILLYEFNR